MVLVSSGAVADYSGVERPASAVVAKVAKEKTPVAATPLDVMDAGCVAPDQEMAAGTTALAAAAFCGDARECRRLVVAGCCPNYANRNLRTPLMATLPCVYTRGLFEKYRGLFRPKFKTKQAAAAGGRLWAALELLQQGSDAQARDLDGRHPAAFAQHEGKAGPGTKLGDLRGLLACLKSQQFCDQVSKGLSLSLSLERGSLSSWANFDETGSEESHRTESFSSSLSLSRDRPRVSRETKSTRHSESSKMPRGMPNSVKVRAGCSTRK